MEREKLLAILTQLRLPVPYVHLFDTLPSTNQKLWQLLEQGAKPGTVVIARMQTAGQGQWGREWSSEAGGLYLSMALAPDLPAQQSYQLTLSSAWGIAMNLRDRGVPVGLKWPNDLILEQRKLGGILTQTKVRQGKIALAVVGVGINWTNSVPPTGINLKSFPSNHLITTIEMLAAHTILGIACGYEFCLQVGIDTLLDSYHQLLTSIGKQVTVNGRTGVVIGVTATGKLRVKLASIHSGKYTEAREIYLNPGTIGLGYGS